MAQAINLEIENPVTSVQLIGQILLHMNKQPRPGQKRKAVMVWGDSGIGKSKVMEQIAAMTSRRLFDFRTNIREPVDMRGIPAADLVKRVTEWLPPSELPAQDGSDGPSIFFVDEINTGTMQMMAVMMQVVLDRKVGDYMFPDNCFIVAAGNRAKDSRAVVQMPKPLRNRFAHYTMIVDHDAWVANAKRESLPSEIIAFVRFRPAHLTRQPIGDECAYASPRSVFDCGDYVNDPPAQRALAFVGLVGKDVGSEMESFVSMYQSLSNIDDILANPTTARVPSSVPDRSELCAVATALGTLADRKNFANIVTYAKRLPREYEILTVTDACQRDPKLKNTTTYGKWAVDNQDVTIQ
jgi:hypothetical protein